MITLRKIFRLLRLINFLILSAIITVIYKSDVNNGIPGSTYFARAKKMMGKLCQILNIEIVTEGTLPKHTGLLVSNHISWLDIPVVGAVLSCLFLSKAEVKSWPIVGWIAKKNGTIFIARGQQGAAGQAKDELAFALSHDVNVLLFPEGTTTDGTYLRNFHPRLFAAAIEENSGIQALTIRYENENGDLSTDIPFVGGQTFIGNLWHILGIKKATATVTLLPAFSAADLSRKEIAHTAREAIHKALHLPVEN